MLVHDLLDGAFLPLLSKYPGLVVEIRFNSLGGQDVILNDYYPRLEEAIKCIKTFYGKQEVPIIEAEKQLCKIEQSEAPQTSPLIDTTSTEEEQLEVSVVASIEWEKIIKEGIQRFLSKVKCCKYQNTRGTDVVNVMSEFGFFPNQNTGVKWLYNAIRYVVNEKPTNWVLATLYREVKFDEMPVSAAVIMSDIQTACIDSKISINSMDDLYLFIYSVAWWLMGGENSNTGYGSTELLNNNELPTPQVEIPQQDIQKNGESVIQTKVCNTKQDKTDITNKGRKTATLSRKEVMDKILRYIEENKLKTIFTKEIKVLMPSANPAYISMCLSKLVGQGILGKEGNGQYLVVSNI